MYGCFGPQCKDFSLAPNPTISIVDDQIDNIKLLAGLLESQGYSVAYALDAETALQRLHLLPPDLILLDLFMPGTNGLEFCEPIKADPIYQ